LAKRLEVNFTLLAIFGLKIKSDPLLLGGGIGFSPQVLMEQRHLLSFIV
jgi:hypothetical protein